MIESSVLDFFLSFFEAADPVDPNRPGLERFGTVWKAVYWSIAPAVHGLTATFLNTAHNIASGIIILFLLAMSMRIASDMVLPRDANMPTLPIFLRHIAYTLVGLSILANYKAIFGTYLQIYINLSDGIVKSINTEHNTTFVPDFASEDSIDTTALKFGHVITMSGVSYLQTGYGMIFMVADVNNTIDAIGARENDDIINAILKCASVSKLSHDPTTLTTQMNLIASTARHIAVRASGVNTAARKCDDATEDDLIKKVKKLGQANTGTLAGSIISLAIYMLLGTLVMFVLLWPFTKYYLANMFAAIFMLVVIPFAILLAPFSSQFLRNATNNFIALSIQTSISGIIFLIVMGLFVKALAVTPDGDPVSGMLLMISILIILMMLMPKIMETVVSIFGSGLSPFLAWQGTRKALAKIGGAIGNAAMSAARGIGRGVGKMAGGAGGGGAGGGASVKAKPASSGGGRKS